MLTHNIVLFLMVLFLAAVFIAPLAEKARIPLGIILVITGFIISEIATGPLGIDTGIRWHNFGKIVFYIIFPILIFHASLNIDIDLLQENIISIAWLSLPLMLISVITIAACIFYGINHPSGFPWIAALITAVLLSAIESPEVSAVLEHRYMPQKMSLILEGESLFSDTAITIIFSVLVMTAAEIQATADAIDIAEVLLNFMVIFLGGLGVGVIVGLIACLMIKFITGLYLFPLITILGTYGSFLLAKDLLYFSGIMAVLSFGLIIRVFSNKFVEPNQYDFTKHLWEFLDYIGKAMVFLLVGTTITLSAFTSHWLAICLAIIAAILARMITILGIFPCLNILSAVEPIPFRQRLILAWGGIRGAVPLALVLSLPLSLDYWYTVQCIVYGVVLFTLFVQATTIAPLSRRLKVI